jgi:type VI secretion system protein ImpB
MARVSFQEEVPKARVNIRYKSTKNGKEEDVELPQRVVVLGDFTQNPEDTDEIEVEEMKKIPIDKTTFNDVMKDMNIGLNMTVDSELKEGEEIKANLKFKSIKDFSPDAIVEQVPELNDLMKLRGLLDDLKAKVITNKQFKKELETILTNAQLTEKTKKELENLCLATTNDNEDPSSGDS